MSVDRVLHALKELRKVMQDNSYEGHYREKVLASGNQLDEWDVEFVTAKREITAYASIGAQTSAESRHIANLKKERVWSKQKSKRLPPWMRR